MLPGISHLRSLTRQHTGLLGVDDTNTKSALGNQNWYDMNTRALALVVSPLWPFHLPATAVGRMTVSQQETATTTEA